MPVSRSTDGTDEEDDGEQSTIPRQDWPALGTAALIIVIANAVAYLQGVTVVYLTILAVPPALVGAAAVNYALYGDPLLQLHET